MSRLKVVLGATVKTVGSGPAELIDEVDGLGWTSVAEELANAVEMPDVVEELGRTMNMNMKSYIPVESEASMVAVTVCPASPEGAIATRSVPDTVSQSKLVVVTVSVGLLRYCVRSIVNGWPSAMVKTVGSGD